MFSMDWGDQRAVGDKAKASKRVGEAQNTIVKGEKMASNEGGALKKSALKTCMDEMEMKGTEVSRLSVLVGETGGAQPVPVTERGGRRDVGRRFRVVSRDILLLSFPAPSVLAAHSPPITINS